MKNEQGKNFYWNIVNAVNAEWGEDTTQRKRDYGQEASGPQSQPSSNGSSSGFNPDDDDIPF